MAKSLRIKRTTYEKQVIKDINKLNYNIRRRLKNVEKHEITKQYQTIKNKFEKLDKSVYKKNIEQLEKLRNKLRYMNSLKSTSVKGMKKAKKAEKKAEEMAEDLREKAGIKPTDNAYKDTKDIRDIIMGIYNRLVEESGWWERGYKSQVREDITTLLFDYDLSSDEVLEYMRKKLKDLYESDDDTYTSVDDEWNIKYKDYFDDSDNNDTNLY